MDLHKVKYHCWRHFCLYIVILFPIIFARFYHYCHYIPADINAKAIMKLLSRKELSTNKTLNISITGQTILVDGLKAVYPILYLELVKEDRKGIMNQLKLTKK